jgi:hypothetical protein
VNLQAVIIRLRGLATTFENRVAGSAEFDLVQLQQRDFPHPAAWVIPTRELATTTTIEERFAVVVAIDNRPDERGQTAAESLDAVRTEILDALVDWSMDSDHKPVEYEEATLADITRATLWYQFEFVVIRVETAIVTYSLTVAVSVAEGSSSATVLANLEAAIASQTGGTQFASDLLEEPLETITKGSIGFQLGAIPLGVDSDSNQSRTILAVELRVHRRLTDLETERAYTRGAMLTDAAAMQAKSFWTVAGVLEVIEAPDATFPGDLVRV